MLGKGKVGSDFRHCVAGGNKTIHQDKLIQIAHFCDENDHIYKNEGVVYNRIIFGANCVTNRYHQALRLSQITQNSKINRSAGFMPDVGFCCPKEKPSVTA